MSDMAIGIPIGLAIGIGTGIATGKKKARAELRDYMQMNAISIQDRDGRPVMIDDLLGTALGADDAVNKKTAIIGIALGVAALLAVAVFLLVR